MVSHMWVPLRKSMGAGAALVGDDAQDVADGAVFNELGGLDPGEHPAAGVVDEEGDAGFVRRLR